MEKGSCMILYRAREYGKAEWTQIAIGGPDEDEEDLAPVIASVIGSALDTSSLHVQHLNEEGVWEDLE